MIQVSGERKVFFSVGSGQWAVAMVPSYFGWRKGSMTPVCLL